MFHRVVCFNALAENVAASVRRDAAVAVTGEFADDSYTREDGGQRVRRIQIEASDVAVSLRYATATITTNQRDPRASSSDAAGEAVAESTTESGTHIADGQPILTVVGSED